MEPFVAALLAVFGVYGIISLVHQLCCRLLCEPRCCNRIVIYVEGKIDNIESTVRSLMLKNPDAEIVIADECSGEQHEILEKLCRDYTQVHIAPISENK